MKNVSNILPNTAHAYLPFKRYQEDASAIHSWLVGNSGRVDTFAYEGDDPLDHQHLYSIVNRVETANNFFDSAALDVWIEQVEDQDNEPRALFAFEDHAAAMLFKLTFGGAA